MRIFSADDTGVDTNEKAGSIGESAVAGGADALLLSRVFQDSFDLTDAAADTPLTIQIPDNAIALRAWMEITTVVQDDNAHASTVAVKLEASDDVVTAAAASGAPWSSTGLKDTNLDGVAANMIKVAGAKVLTMEVGIVGPATKLIQGAGTIWIEYVVGN